MLRIFFLLLSVSVFIAVAQPGHTYAASLWNSDKGASDAPSAAGKKANLWSNLKTRVRPKAGASKSVRRPPSRPSSSSSYAGGGNYSAPQTSIQNDVANSILLNGGNKSRAGVFDLSRSSNEGFSDCKKRKNEYEKFICEARVESAQAQSETLAQLDAAVSKGLALETGAFQQRMASQEAAVKRAHAKTKAKKIKARLERARAKKNKNI